MLGLTTTARVEEIEAKIKELETHARHAEIAAENGKLRAEVQGLKRRNGILLKIEKERPSLIAKIKRLEGNLAATKTHLAGAIASKDKQMFPVPYVQSLTDRIAQLVDQQKVMKSTLGPLKHENNQLKSKAAGMESRIKKLTDTHARESTIWQAMPQEFKDLWKATRRSMKEKPVSDASWVPMNGAQLTWHEMQNDKTE